MTYQSRQLSRTRTAGPALPSARQSFASATATVANARASTTLAMSISVALRYLEGRPHRPAAPASAAIPNPAVS